MVAPEDDPFLDSDTTIGVPRILAGVSASRHYRHARHGFREGLAEVKYSSSIPIGVSSTTDRVLPFTLFNQNSAKFSVLTDATDRVFISFKSCMQHHSFRMNLPTLQRHSSHLSFLIMFLCLKYGIMTFPIDLGGHLVKSKFEI